MKPWRSLILGLCILSSLSAVSALATENAGAADLQQLLQRVKAAQANDSTQNRQLEQAFLADRASQKALLEKARQQLASLQQQSETLKTRFDGNEAELAELESTLRERSGNLGELFGVVRQVSGDLETQLKDSLISSQFPQRRAFLEALAKSKQLPEISALQQLWFLLQQEMTEAGRIVRYRAPLVDADGRETLAEVLRIGPFVALQGNRYLQYNTATGHLMVLPRQPNSGLRAVAEEFNALPAGEQGNMAIDPTRGSLFQLLAQKPTFAERLAQGGWVGYLILTLGGIGLVLAVWRLASLLRVSRRVDRQLQQLEDPRTDNPLGRVVLAIRRSLPSDRTDNETAGTETADILELRIEEAVLKEAPALVRAQPTLKLLAAVAPLLGLLGTVVGMIATFQAITLFGTSDPKLMAGGISQALVTTVLGLVVAIPLLFCHSLLQGRSQRLLQLLAQESAGRLAEHQEKTRPSGLLKRQPAAVSA